MAHKAARPLSPHLGIWKWGPAMTVSILHRVTGDGMAIVGGLVFVWWLTAAAMGKEAYDFFLWFFQGLAGGTFGYIVGIGLTYCLRTPSPVADVADTQDVAPAPERTAR